MGDLMGLYTWCPLASIGLLVLRLTDCGSLVLAENDCNTYCDQEGGYKEQESCCQMDDGLDAEIESVGDDNAEPEYFDTGNRINKLEVIDLEHVVEKSVAANNENTEVRKQNKTKKEAGRLLRMSKWPPNMIEIKRNLIGMKRMPLLDKTVKRSGLVRMAKRPSLVRMAKRPSLVRMAKRPSLVRMTKRTSLLRMAKRPNLVRMTKRPNLIMMAKRPNLVRMSKRPNLIRMAKRPNLFKMAKRSGPVHIEKKPKFIEIGNKHDKLFRINNLPQSSSGIKRNQMLRMM